MSDLELADLSDARHLHDRRLLLPLCKASSLFTIRIDTTKSFAILVKRSHLPVMVFSPSVFPECCAFTTCHLLKYIMSNDLFSNEPFPLRVISCCAQWWGQARLIGMNGRTVVNNSPFQFSPAESATKRILCSVSKQAHESLLQSFCCLTVAGADVGHCGVDGLVS
jgi:hypothetical protein